MNGEMTEIFGLRGLQKFFVNRSYHGNLSGFCNDRVSRYSYPFSALFDWNICHECIEKPYRPAEVCLLKITAKKTKTSSIIGHFFCKAPIKKLFFGILSGKVDVNQHSEL